VQNVRAHLEALYLRYHAYQRAKLCDMFFTLLGARFRLIFPTNYMYQHMLSIFAPFTRNFTAKREIISRILNYTRPRYNLFLTEQYGPTPGDN